MDLYERILSVPAEDIEIELRGMYEVPWADFYLNPRRLRGSDFLMRWSQGTWSERCLVDALPRTTEFFALPYGPSGTAPANDPRAYELYFERLEHAGLGQIKRPDLLIFKKADKRAVDTIVGHLGGLAELPFTPEDNTHMQDLLRKAVVATECENSLWLATKMPHYGAELTPQRRLGGKLGLKKTAVLPTIIIKEEDRGPLQKWQKQNKAKIHIWHVFFDLAFGLSLDDADNLIETGQILPTEQVFQAPGGATTKKTIYKFYYHYGYPLAKVATEPSLVADHIIDKNGHILPYVRFEGGSFAFSNEAEKVLEEIAKDHED